MACGGRLVSADQTDDHVDGSALPGAAGVSLIAGHRDTHFGFLRDLRAGDAIRLEDNMGAIHHFRVTATQVVDARHVRIDPAGGSPRLVLSTCYPFDALAPGGPLRFLVIADDLASKTGHWNAPSLPLERAVVEDGTGIEPQPFGA